MRLLCVDEPVMTVLIVAPPCNARCQHSHHPGQYKYALVAHEIGQVNAVRTVDARLLSEQFRNTIVPTMGNQIPSNEFVISVNVPDSWVHQRGTSQCSIIRIHSMDASLNSGLLNNYQDVQ